jgi:DNA polymerase-3 subunit gamma/tau
MSYKIFARKYRPQAFEEVIGQKSVVRTIQNAIQMGRISQAYLFSGMRGTGKTSVARILARALNCANGPTASPCKIEDKDVADGTNKPCDYCAAISEDRAIDVLEIDGASNRGIDEIRALRESLKYKAIYTRYKVVIIDEVHQITKEGFNALLKTLEEPPPNTVFIFATTEFNKVPATIVSRCQHFEFRKISHKDIINHLVEIARKEAITITPAGLAMIAEAADGSMRDAQSLLDQAVAFSGENIGDEDLKTILGAIGPEVVFRFSTAVLEEKPEDVFPLVESVAAAGYDLRFVFGKFIEHFRALLLVRSVERPEDLLLAGAEEIQALRVQASKATVEDLLRYLLALQQAEAGLKYSAMPRIYLEAFLIKLCHFRKIVPLQELIRDVESLKREPQRAFPRPPAASPAGAPSAGGTGRAAPAGDAPQGPAPAAKTAPPPQKDVFKRVLEKLAVDRAPLAALLAQYSSIMVRDNVLDVFFASGKGFFVTSIQEKDIRAVERAASEVFGRETKVRFAEENATDGGPIRPGRELEAALKDPAVQFFMNTFKASVLSVDPIPAPREAAPKGPGPTENET